MYVQKCFYTVPLSLGMDNNNIDWGDHSVTPQQLMKIKQAAVGVPVYANRRYHEMIPAPDLMKSIILLVFSN